ncbi:dTDP-glucose 4,6-dehydratase [Proteiniborus sp. MB09-C3]|uniref:dTDP-glucose 4,6-dehydratase n=1 Tax=Proteiniborus sp. MB09-C3 TaxID=3050072 RepID=UPI0025521F97|nr:dTDP-glucose 4,6-dehydratase [Proteiniborus sp. MB09-C3]WIV12032.1 dTDP-glucose 4,6-dehydratase [Proteiniborus sp. MB09-C3]
MNILVTGGAGFIGSNFIRYMLENYNYKIVNLDLLTYAGNLKNLDDISDDSRYYFIKGDICDRSLLEKIFRKFDINVVINFAAESHVDRSIEEPEVFLRTNVLGTQALLDTAKSYWKLEPNDKYSRTFEEEVKYIQVSTDEVYGTLGTEGYFTEKTNISPNSPYSASKASADMLVRAYGETYGLPVNITRCSNNYGPYQFPEKLIPLMINNALQDKYLPIYGDGKQVRDWLYVKDHCTAIDIVLHKGKIGEVYNIGGNNEKANIEIVKLIIKALGKSDDLIEYVKDRPGHDRRYAIDNSKITKELGWSPSYTFEEGMDKTIKWYLDNREWLKEIISGEYLKYYEGMYSNSVLNMERTLVDTLQGEVAVTKEEQ